MLHSCQYLASSAGYVGVACDYWFEGGPVLCITNPDGSTIGYSYEVNEDVTQLVLEDNKGEITEYDRIEGGEEELGAALSRMTEALQ